MPGRARATRQVPLANVSRAAYPAARFVPTPWVVRNRRFQSFKLGEHSKVLSLSRFRLVRV
jgi:hypothetical protein